MEDTHGHTQPLNKVIPGPGKAQIDVSRQRYPYCIVWSPLPPITWFLPFIGHTGICDSEGIIWDFAGPYTIGRDRMAFGNPTRYIPLDPEMAKAMSWDEAVRDANTVYSKRMHNICWDNCHNHVAQALNAMGYTPSHKYGMLGVGVWVFFAGRFTSTADFIKTYLPFSIICCMFILFTQA